MALRMTVLASGSRGNASLVETNGFGVLLDSGLGPRQLVSRLAAAGASWQRIHAMLLTHTHTDHWNDRTFKHLARRRIPVWCHGEHHAVLEAASSAFVEMLAADLVRNYEAGQELRLARGFRCRPLPLCHDGGATFGFRFETSHEGSGAPCALGYVADLGCWDESLAEALAGVDLLALEFNHDVALEVSSGRQPRLIERVLSDDGHLSNAQAAALLREVLRRSDPGRVKQLIQLHLSRDCNRPALAVAAARAVAAELELALHVHTAGQDEPGPTFRLGPATVARVDP